MQSGDLTQFSVLVGDLFTRATPSEVDGLFTLLERFSWDVVYAALHQHRRQLGRDNFRPDPNRVRSMCLQLAGEDAAGVTHRNVLAPLRLEQTQLRDQWRADDALIAEAQAGDPAVLDELQRRAIEAIDARHPGAAPILARKGLRDRGLRSQVARYLRERAAEHAREAVPA
jgi:hypothetical protein